MVEYTTSNIQDQHMVGRLGTTPCLFDYRLRTVFILALNGLPMLASGTLTGRNPRAPLGGYFIRLQAGTCAVAHQVSRRVERSC
jgi:hypothetical protein